MLTVTWGHSECCVPSGLDFKVTGTYIIVCFEGHWVAVNMTWAHFFERAAISLFARPVRCSARGCSSLLSCSSDYPATFTSVHFLCLLNVTTGNLHTTKFQSSFTQLLLLKCAISFSSFKSNCLQVAHSWISKHSDSYQMDCGMTMCKHYTAIYYIRKFVAAQLPTIYGNMYEAYEVTVQQ